MRLTVRIIVSALLLVPLHASSQQVYKWVDEQGRTTYSSSPPPAGAKKPELVPIPPPPPAPPPAVSAKPDPAQPAAKKPGTPKPTPEVPYTSAELTVPASEETIWSNTGEVPFSIALKPALQQGHRIRLIVNGAAQGELLGASQGTLLTPERGSYSLQAEVVDRSGTAVATTNSVTFYVQQASAQGPIHKKKK